MEQRYAQDELVEKKALNSNFRKPSLEQRIKNNRNTMLSNSALDAIADLEEEKNAASRNKTVKVDALKFEVLQKQEEADKPHMVLRRQGRTTGGKAGRRSIPKLSKYNLAGEDVGRKQNNKTNYVAATTAADNKNLVLSLRDQLAAHRAANEQLALKNWRQT